MEILEKVAYMKGLAEGIGLDVKSKEGKLLKVMMDILDDVALELQDIRDEQSDLEEGLDAVSEDLADVESCLFDLEDDEDEDEEDEEVYQTTCPNCDEEIFFDEDILADGSARTALFTFCGTRPAIPDNRLLTAKPIPDHPAYPSKRPE